MAKPKAPIWYVDPEHSEEFTELLFIAEKTSPLYVAIGLCDTEGVEEFGHKYWWEVIAGEQGWKEKDVADTFTECAAAALACAASFAQELAEMEHEDDEATDDAAGHGETGGAE